MVAAFDYCLHGRGGAAPSIDTAMHGLVDAPHVDHLHPDSGIALATAADGEALTKECFGDRVVWVPWRRPGFQLGLDIAAIAAGQPAGHRRASSAATASPRGAPPARSARRTRCEIIRTAEAFLAERGRAEPFGPVVAGLRAAAAGTSAARGPPRSRRSCAGSRRPTAPQVGHFTDTRRRARLPRARRAPAARRARHLVPRPLPAHQGAAARARPAADAPLERRRRAAAGAARGVPRGLRAPTTSGTPPPDARAMRGADPAIVLSRASACSPSARTSRPRASPASSTSTPST